MQAMTRSGGPKCVLLVKFRAMFFTFRFFDIFHLDGDLCSLEHKEQGESSSGYLNI